MAFVLTALTVPLAGTGQAATGKTSKTGPARADTFEPSADVQAKLAKGAKFVNTAPSRAASQPGVVKTWVGLDDVAGRFYTKNYKLRAKGKHIEVWTAYGERTAFGHTGKFLKFQPGDCRNGERTRVTDAQVNYLINQFDNNIYPKESNVFSRPPHRNGENSFLAQAFGLPRTYYGGDKDDIVVLVDNVRDDNWYDKNNTQGFSYIAGFFSSSLNFFFDRNVMTIDGFDWLHRTGANPPNEPVPGDNCTSAPARPFLYEGVFAHEYQHLLESYEDPSEATWINEGLSDFAIDLTNYTDPRTPVTQTGFDSHIQCFEGHNSELTPANPNPRAGGPENSLNLWGDQDFDHEAEILCDYGAAFSWMLWARQQYGLDFMTQLHRSDESGFDGVNDLLDTFAPGTTMKDTINYWLATMALDGVLDDGATLVGADASQHQVNHLHSFINWDTDDAYDTPGGPPNGGDFVRLRNGSGDYLSADQINSISFNGVSNLPPLPITWEIDENPPGHAGNPALYSTNADNRNDIIVQELDIPSGSPELTFDAAWDLETTFDFAYVQITTDGGETYHSLACTDTEDDNAGDNVGPGFGQGFNGFDDTPTFQPQTCDLSDYAGMDNVGLAFRYFSDSNTHGAGFWADDIRIDGTLIPGGAGGTLEPWQSGTQYNPTEVDDWTVQLVSYNNAHTTAHLTRLPLDGSFDGSISGSEVTDAVGSSAEVVSAIVTYNDNSEIVTQYAPYTLTVNGVVQPGGGS